ncbi:hypothetical protein SNE40_015513 [Patella caerulea]|uniref:BZIP domain-containing protein n=1 Tax=Patella caerulea TaxID=87958 RepID=A0AAN8JFU9_PATCE
MNASSSYPYPMDNRDVDRPFKSYSPVNMPTTFYGSQFSNSSYIGQTGNCGMQLPNSTYEYGNTMPSCSGGQDMRVRTNGHGMHLQMPPIKPEKEGSMDPYQNHGAASDISSPSPHDDSRIDLSPDDRIKDIDGINCKMPPKKRPCSIPETQKDDTYWDKRKKNNDSAKRSREARRMKEEQIALRVVYLEQENLQLRTEVSLLKSEIEKLRCMLYNS